MREERKIEYEDSGMAKQRAKLWKTFRRNFNLSQKRLADEAGISRRTVQMIERGENGGGLKPRRATIINFNNLRNKYLRENGIVDKLQGNIAADLFCNMEEKECSRCGIIKNVNDDFGKKISSFDKRESICKICRSNEYLSKKLGVGLDWYEKTLYHQNGGCAICKLKIPYANGKKGKFCIDHDHNCCPTGGGCPMCIRGLLCMVCNTRLGLVEKHGFKHPLFEEYLSRFQLK